MNEYIQFGQFERTEEIDRRIFERNLSDIPLRPLFDIRGVETRQTLFQVAPDVGNKPKPKVGMKQYPEYDLNKVFSPVQTPPPSFLKKTDTESYLRNQYFGLQHGASQSVYVPSSDSDLYKVTVPPNNNMQKTQPFPLLSKEEKLNTNIHPIVMQSLKQGSVFNNSGNLRGQNVAKNNG